MEKRNLIDVAQEVIQKITTVGVSLDDGDLRTGPAVIGLERELNDAALPS